ncbi:MAG: AsmA family protein [Pseudomonadota bacterium]
MFKVIKFLIKTVLFLLFLIIVAAIAIPIFIDPNDYKQQIEQQVKLQTGSDLKIIGDINVSLGLSPSYLPTSLSFDLGETELSQPAGFSQLSKNSFFRVNKIAINASIIPLVQENRLEVGKIILDQANIFLIKDKQGTTNWDSFISAIAGEPSANKKPSASNKKEPAAANKSQFDMPEIQIEGVEINNSIVSYDDYSSGQHLKLEKLTLTISELKENKPIDIEFSTLFDSKEQQLKGDFSIKTHAIINIKQQLYQLQQTDLQLNVAGPSIPGGKNHTQLSADIDLDLVKQLLTIKSINLDSYKLHITGDMHITDLITNPQFNSQIELAAFSPKELSKRLQLSLPKMKNDKLLNNASIKLSLAGNAKQLKLTTLHAVLDDIVINGSASIKNLQNPSYQLNLDINKLHLDDYALVAAVSDPKAKTIIAAKGKKPLANKKPVATQTANAKQALIPVELIKSLNVNGQLKIGELLSNGIKMSNIILTLKSNKGLLILDPVQSDFYKGKLKLKTTLDVRKKTPKISLTQDFNQIDLGQLLLDVTGTQEFTGRANISSQLTTQGNFQKQLIKNSNGKGKFLITDGHIAKLDIMHTLRAAHAIFYGKTAPTKQQESNTSFTELKGSIDIKNGVVTNKDLFSKSPVMQLTGAGSADLVKEYLDYTLKIMLLNSLQIDKDTNTTDFHNKEIPYTIKGKFSELSEKANMKKILQQQVKAEAKKQVSKKVDKYLSSEKGKKLEEKIGKENLDALKGLFKF